MRSWFLSYNTQDQALMEALEAALRQKDAGAHIFFAPKSLRAGSYFLPELAKEIAKSTAFVLLVGEKGIGRWQVIEYYEAFDRRIKEPNYPVILVLYAGQAAPGLPFLQQLHRIVTNDPASEDTIGKLFQAADGAEATPSELWRHTAPYRGLAAMTESDSDFFFGRGRETAEVINALAGSPGKLPILLGNSGVGKSSLAQAGVLAALLRQGFPKNAANAAHAGLWPHVFRDSRHWCFLTLRPGAEPLRALAEPFLSTWQYEATDPRRAQRQAEWVEALLGGNLGLRDLLDATEQRYQELGQAKPDAFFLYIDQGEELYVGADERQRRTFSKVIARGLGDPRLRALMSLRSDFFGDLQRDESLYAVHWLISVPPLRESELREVVSRPAQLLSARFETEGLASDISRRAAEESTKDVGALPLLSYLLDDMWTQMVKRGDGVLRLPMQAIALGGVLVERANAFLASHPDGEGALRRLFTLKLATVRPDGEPMRRRALRPEFTDKEWRLVSELADHPHRLLVTGSLDSGEVYAEVAHEAIFGRWDKLKQWIAAEREFLAWRSGLEAARQQLQVAPDRSKDDTLLMGHALARAQDWLAKRADDLSQSDREFIERSIEHRRIHRMRTVAGVLGLAMVLVAGTAGWANRERMELRSELWADLYWRHMVRSPEQERTLKPEEEFQECTRCPAMVVMPPGEFTMGSPLSGRLSEQPQHKVTIAMPFAVSKFEVTFDEWDACFELGGCLVNAADQPSHAALPGPWGRGKRPVINVSWGDAQEFVAWLSKETGKSYRLLTEAEWEYAARAGSTTNYSWGDDIRKEGKVMANCYGCGSEWDNQKTAPVGSFAANAFGLYDMHGNVWELVEDCWSENYDGAPVDGSARPTCNNGWRVARGGSFAFPPRGLRSATRIRLLASSRSNTTGLRVGRTITP
jgi:formylglycine-generating enzyme required for sulfatase activity